MLTATGDILSLKRGLVLHQVNCQGKTGYLARALRQRWPEHFGAYFDMVRSQQSEGDALGRVAVGFSNGFGVAHVFGQIMTGPNTDLGAVDRALAALALLVASDPALRSAKIFAPFKMGCGQGGGDWAAYSAIMDKHLCGLTIIRNPRFD